MKGKTPGRIYVIQPPLVQLNGPYPAPYYLKAFLDARGYRTRVLDHSIGLFERIFCKTGLKKIFADARRIYQNRGRPVEAGGYTPDLGNPYILYQTERFLSEEDRWLSTIGRLVDFLRGRDREWGHLLTLANGVLPGGPRFDACLESLGGNPPPDAAPLLASKLLADLADFIGSVLDPSFGLVRYAGALASAYGDFAALKDSPDRYIMAGFYRPLLDELWDEALSPPHRGLPAPGGRPSWNERRPPSSSPPSKEGAALPIPPRSRGLKPTGGPVLAITIPFSGCLAGALTCAASARARFGETGTIIAGGGYVNTELRFLEDESFFDYFDYLSFDRGYGSLEAILRRLGDPGETEPALYKTRYYSRKERRIIGSPDSPGDSGPGPILDREGVRTVFPDYGEVDFTRYLYPVDEVNPMHRLWSDGHWLKAYLAHGCYWHSCAFCDTALDYIRGFEPVEGAALFRHLLDQAEKTGVRGVHLVDEAAPVSSLIALAELNMREGLPLVFWGNIRFEKAFTPDVAAFLAAGGLLGVSGGIEVASKEGFRRVRKGVGLPEVVRASAAFKEAGILTHAYLIYGYWDEPPEEIIDSAETLRQLFAEGLLDSAFWHQFILTRHSPLYAEWQAGLHPELKVSDRPVSGAGGKGKIFALNDLSFAGEEGFNRFAEPLDRLLGAWMAGDTALPVEGAFPFPVPSPSVPVDLVAELLDAYARDRDQERRAPPPGTGRVCFLGSRPHPTSGFYAPRAGRVKGEPRPPSPSPPSKEGAAPPIPPRSGGLNPPMGAGASLFWRWRLSDQRLPLPEAAAERTGALLEQAARPGGMVPPAFYQELERILGSRDARGAWQKLRNQGLVIIPPTSGPPVAHQWGLCP